MKVGSAIFLLLAGAALGWLASALLGDRDETRTIGSDQVVSTDTGDGEAVETTAPEIDDSQTSLTQVAVTAAESEGLGELSDQPREPANAPSLPAPIVLERNSHIGGQLSELPANAALSAVELADTVFSDTQIVCEFEGWNGGPLVIDLVDYFGAGTARMSGALSAPESEFVVRMDTTTAGLHFSGTTSNGNFLAVTIFGVPADSDGYLAVHSRHQGSMTVNSTTSGYWGTQWYGGCR